MGFEIGGSAFDSFHAYPAILSLAYHPLITPYLKQQCCATILSGLDDVGVKLHEKACRTTSPKAAGIAILASCIHCGFMLT